jgi:hypothetical protein
MAMGGASMNKRHGVRLGGLTVLMTLAVISQLLAPAARAGEAASSQIAGADATPVLAYYYIWFTQESWNSAKLDIPLLGTYSSDDREVMREHIRWAKSVGIDGFIVSWKDSETLTRRLIQLIEVAREESFKLAIIYQALDFYREPIPVVKIATDLQLFVELFAGDPVFDLYGKPLVIWSGTWRFDRAEIDQVTAKVRSDLLVLGSQKSVKDYEAIADLVDGNAYYWSSVNPATHPDYPGKMRQMGEAVHANGGLWIAPAAPGFDARHLGGEREIPREGGAMLETQLNVAFSSQPDAIGLISWNEFSENSHVEPSCLYGTQSLTTLARLLGGTIPDVRVPCDQAALVDARSGTYARLNGATPVEDGQDAATLGFDWDSSAPEGRPQFNGGVQGTVLLAPVSALMLLSIFVVIRRSLRQPAMSAGVSRDAIEKSPSDARSTGKEGNDDATC